MPDFMKLLSGGIKKGEGSLISQIKPMAAKVQQGIEGISSFSLPELTPPYFDGSGWNFPQAALAGGGTTRTTNLGGVYITVNGYNARNDDELAQIVADKINGMIHEVHEDDSVFKRTVLQSDIQNAIRKAKKGGVNMAIKSSNVAARMEPELKEQAEMILSNLGIPASTAINMFYRQIVLWNGLPFRPCMPANYPKSRSEMTDDEFNARMAIGYAQAQADQSAPADEVFARLIGEIEDGRTGQPGKAV